ncbi:MAG: radical SAM protein [bacterium]
MRADTKLKVLGELSQFDVCGSPQAFVTHKTSPRFPFIYHSIGENNEGNSTRLFKILQTNACEHNCSYCANRKDRNFERLSFTPKELAETFMYYYEENLVEGCFISSAINKGVEASQQSVLDTIKLLRKKYKYEGYIHTKILPGVDEEMIREVAKYSDRLSINLEAPGDEWLSKMSKHKKFSNILSQLQSIAKISEEKKLKSGVTTQFMVGGTNESDKEIMNLVSKLYKEFKLRRVYYSGFMPIENTPLENLSPCFPQRELRLYQADSLIRQYNFTSEELPFDSKGLLPINEDPKLAWAKQHLDLFPIEINKASFEELLRVPGFGKISADKIIEARQINKITTLDTLKRLGAPISKARNFITLENHFFPTKSPELEAKYTDKAGAVGKLLQKQLFLWEEM